MKQLRTILMLAASGVITFVLSATPVQAFSLTYTDSPTWILNSNYWTTLNNSNLNANDIEDLTGINTDGFTLLYKDNVGGSEEGSLAGSYETTFSNTASEPSDFLIDYISGNFASCPTCLLVVKDGKHDPANYVFNLGSWSGRSDITGTGFWPNGGAISNVAIWGTSAQVPEPASLLLLCSGLAMAGIWRRKFVKL